MKKWVQATSLLGYFEIGWAGIFLLHASLGWAQNPAASGPDRLKVNWGDMRVDFYGESQAAVENEDFKQVEIRARADAMATAKARVIEFYNEHMKKNNLPFSAEAAGRAGEAVAKSPRSLRTEYFSDGRVRVYYESSLALALPSLGQDFSAQTKQPLDQSMFSGLILRTEKSLAPRASYQVVDETGRVLYSQKDVLEEAFNRNLMGRWFQNPSRKEVSAAVGTKPISINFEVDEQGRFRVQGSAWQEAMGASQAVLQNARIAIIGP